MVPLAAGLSEPDREHEARASAAIVRALRDIPFYGAFYAKGAAAKPLPTQGEPLTDVLGKLPLMFKKDIRAVLPKQWVPTGRSAKEDLASGAIELVETSGSTADRTRILWDQGWWLTQEERAFRTHPLVAQCFGGAAGRYRESILTTPVCGLNTCHTGDLSFDERLDEFRLFLNMRPDPTFWKPEDMLRMLDELGRHETVGLETDPMYFAVLARFAAEQERTIDVRGFVVLTYAFASQAHVRSIRRAYAGPLLNLYGASEVGVLFMEGEDGLLHHCPLTTHVELVPIKVPTPGAKDVALVVATTLDRVVQPLVRFVVGDVVEVAHGAASAFTTVPPIRSVEGRLHDAVLRPDGALVTCGAIDRALKAAPGIAFYQVNQRTPSAVEVDVVPEPSESAGGTAPEREARTALEPLFEGLELTVRTAAAIAAEPSGKFRIVRRHFPLDLGKLFAGCEGISL